MNQVLMRLIEEYRKEHKITAAEESEGEQAHKKPRSILKSKTDVIVKGQEDMLVRFARCCNPVPGDDIVGYITRGRGVSIHRKDCNNLSDFEPEREIEVAWAVEGDAEYAAGIQMLCYDRAGILVDISNQIYQNQLSLLSINAQAKNGLANITMTVEIKNTAQLQLLIKTLKKISGVIEVYRMNK